MGKENRRFDRPEATNLLDYRVVDEQGGQGEYAMGRTLNISQGGILMETHIPLPQGQQVMITLGLDDDLISVTGKIVYTTFGDGRHQNGIEFSHVDDKDRDVLDNYIKAFHEGPSESEEGD